MNYIAAANYSCGSYGAGGYSTESTCASTSVAQPTSQGGALAQTGYDVLLPICLAVSVMIASAVMLIKNLRKPEIKK